mgnify:CR=1 FL=1
MPNNIISEEEFLSLQVDTENEDEDGNIIPPFTFEPDKFVSPLMNQGNYITPIGERNSYDAESVEGF